MVRSLAEAQQADLKAKADQAKKAKGKYVRVAGGVHASGKGYISLDQIFLLLFGFLFPVCVFVRIQ